MISRHKTKLTLLTVLLTATIGIGEVIGGTSYPWTGDGNDNDWTTSANWSPQDGDPPPDDYPGEVVTTDHAIIDDTTPEPVVFQDKANLQIASLYLGDGHAIDLENGITVTTVSSDKGSLEIAGQPPFVGEPPVEWPRVARDSSPIKEISAQWIMVNFDQATVISTDEYSKITTN